MNYKISFLLIVAIAVCSCNSSDCITYIHVGEEDKPIYPIIISINNISQLDKMSYFSGRDSIVFCYNPSYLSSQSCQLNKENFIKLNNYILTFKGLQKQNNDIRYGTLKIIIWKKNKIISQFYINCYNSVDFLNGQLDLLKNSPAYDNVKDMMERFKIPENRKPGLW